MCYDEKKDFFHYTTAAVLRQPQPDKEELFMSLIDLMKARYSVRQYKSTPVEEEKLMAVL